MHAKKSKYISVQDVANYLEVSKQSVHKWINNKDIPVNRLPSGMIKILRSEFLSYLEDRGLHIDREFFNLKTLRVVVINGDNKVQNLIKDIFNNLSVLNLVNGGFDIDVEYSPSGILGLLKIGELKPDLVVFDIDQPGVNGLEICKSIYIDKKLKHAHIIVFTENVVQYKRELKELDVKFILKKPVSKKYLVESVVSVLRKQIN